MGLAARRQQLDTDRGAAGLRPGFLFADGGFAAARRLRLNPPLEVEHFSPLRGLGLFFFLPIFTGSGASTMPRYLRRLQRS